MVPRVTNDITATAGMYDIMQYTSPGSYRGLVTVPHFLLCMPAPTMMAVTVCMHYVHQRIGEGILQTLSITKLEVKVSMHIHSSESR